MWVCVDASQTIPLSVLARNPHKEFVRETGRERGMEGLREERMRETAERSSREQSAGESSQEMRVGQRGDQTTEVRKAAVRTCGLCPGWPTRENESAFLMAFGGVSRKYPPAIACKCTESLTKVSQTSPSCDWSEPKSVFVCCSFSSTSSVVYFVCW